MRAPDPSLTEQLLDCGVIVDRQELEEVLHEVTWITHQAEITSQLPLECEDPSVPPALEAAS